MKILFKVLILSLIVTLKGFCQANQPLVQTVNSFLNTLSADEMKKTVYDFNDSLRYKWTNLPVGLVPRRVLPTARFPTKVDWLFIGCFRPCSAHKGYLKTTSIMALDDILNSLYQQSFDEGKIDQKLLKRMQDFKWAYGNYFVSIWRKPDTKAPWGLNFGGHHMALSLTSDGKNITMSPYFIGTDPSEVKFGKYSGLRVLSKEEDYGFMFINSLTDAQKAVAILKQDVPKDIITSPQAKQRIEGYYGIAAKELNETQMTIFKLLIQEYTHNFEHEKAHQLMEKIMKSGIEKVYFAWIGSLDNNKPHYYIIHGPDFLIEYDNVGFQNDGNHIHAILREKGNDFGEDILHQHYKTSKH